MDLTTLLVLVLILGAIGFFLLRPRLRSWTGPTELPAASPSPATPQSTPPGGVPLSPDLGALKQGDAISLWDGTDATVRGSYDCREEVNGRTTEWRWVFLSGDRVLELLPHGQVLYAGGGVAHQGDDFYVDVEAKLRR